MKSKCELGLAESSECQGKTQRLPPDREKKKEFSLSFILSSLAPQ